VFVATAERFFAIDVGGWRACGLTSDGRVFCWGARLSAGEQPAPPLCEQRSGAQCDYAPRQVPASRPYAAIVVGKGYEDDNVMCGLAADGTADCWGNNYLGRTGTGTPSSTAAQITTPTRLAGNVVLRNVTAGWSHACGECPDGAVLCWGDKWALGNDTLQAPPSREVPAPIAAASGMILHGVTAGGGSTCGLSSAGEAYCWIYGRTPHPVAPGRTFTRLAAASWFACGLEVNGAMSCWVYLTAPVPVAPGMRFRSVAVTDGNGDSVCGIAIDGGAYCAGFTNSSASGGTAGPPRRVPGDI
jgi:hypothetical protein